MTDLRRWPEADALLDRALELPRGERIGFIEREAGHDRALAEALRGILEEAERDDGFLEPGEPALAGMVSAAWDEEAAAAGPALAVGQRFTTYEVLGLAGRGGMGEVYRARDARLGRLVALKVMPHEFVEDRQRLARFDREARLLASLNHPNIGAIYGLAEDGGRQALVLEFVEGTTLAERIARGPLSLREAVPIARQIALALEAAHRRGIVHRDLKPSNISLMPDGTAKVLDFGLAKDVERPAHADPGDISAVLGPGRIVGTPAYMSPEQASGGELDRRTDIWAFGCVLYEMLTGVRAFEGNSSPEVIARVLGRDPDFEKLPSATPRPIVRLLRRTLVKDPKLRLAGLGEAVATLEEAGRGLSGRPLWSWMGNRRTLGAVAVLAGAALGAAVLIPRLRAPAAPAVVRLGVPVPPTDTLIASGQQVAALSPDGRTVVYRASRDGVVRLFRRALDGMQSEPLPGTENASAPFFSTDGAWLGFDGEGALRKVALAGGSPATICPAPGGVNASWAGDTIVFATATGRVLYRVNASGGTPEPLTALDAAAGDVAHAFPHVMPGGSAALFTIVRGSERHLAAVRFDTRAVRLIGAGAQPRYLDGGFLLFVRNDTLWAAPFDARRLEMTGTPSPVLEGLDTAGGVAAHFAVASDGSLMYAPRRQEVRDRQLVWLDRRGAETVLPFEPKGYTRASLSPDGRRVAVALSEQNNTDIWIGDVGTGALTRLTRDATSETAPLWTADGQAIVFRSDRERGGLFKLALGASNAPERLTTSGERLHTPHGWSRDGRTLLFTEFRSYAEQAIFRIPSGGAAQGEPLLTGPFAQLRPQVSPDGRWMAYQSDESGRFEIYVRPFPDVNAGRWQVSSGGGTSPRWAHSGREVFYYDGHAVVAASVGTGSAFSVLGHRRLFTYAPFGSRLGPDFDVTPDDRRFLMLRSGEDTPATRLQLVLVQNWVHELTAQIRR